MTHFTTFWESIRNSSGWFWALAEVGRKPELLFEKGPKWQESPLHWASLGNLTATMELSKLRPELEITLDSSQRLPLDWVVEKIYFMLDEAPKGEREARLAFAIGQSRDCALFLLRPESVESSKYSGHKPNLQRCFQVALASGELTIASLLHDKCPMEVSYWLGGLAGNWSSSTEVESYTNCLSEKFGITRETLVDGLTLGMHVISLWATNRITTDIALSFHNLGFLLDTETRDFSLETFCFASNVSASKYEELIRRIG